MIFTELRFVLFFALVFGVHWSLDSQRARKVWLLLASYFFYAAWDWRFLSLIVISTLVDYVAGLRLGATDDPLARRRWLLASLATNLGMLGFFKYFGFFVDSAEDFFGFLGLGFSRPVLEIVLPVGISFFTFQTMSYSIDVFRGRLEPTRDLLDLSLFVAFFPQLVAGPIVRASTFLPQLQRRGRLSAIQARPLVLLFLTGFVKKACISDNVAMVVDQYFASPSDFTAAAAYLGVVLYAIQIFCDFSGYSDMAIASAGLLGYTLGDNFRAPYMALNVREFWQRWHISLSTWLRDYLYVPLGGSRGSKLFTARNILLTMLLGGLWHGAAWRFVVWGLLHGVALVAHRALFGTEHRQSSVVFRWLSRLATFYWICLTWIFFRAPDLETARQALSSWILFDSPGTQSFAAEWWFLVALLVPFHYLGERVERPASALPAWAFSLAYGAAVALALLFVRFEAQPFIYFQF